MDAVLSEVAGAATAARTLEELTRPLLQMLEQVTGLESTYLTTVNPATGTHQVLYARNARALQIVEGSVRPWDEALCKRAIDENRLYSDDVQRHWGDNRAARELGLQTYISTPLHTPSGELYGTLCAASTARQPVSAEAGQVLRLFASLIEQQLSREHLLNELQQANAELRSQALTDPLTGLLNRRALTQELDRQRATAQRAGHWLLVGAIDLDGFKQINDSRGHEAGDALLRGITLSLQTALRGGDALARMGGDEFVVVGLGPRLEDDGEAAARLLQQRLSQATIGQYAVGGECLAYGGASVGVVSVEPGLAADEALSRSDAAMYRVKQARRSTRSA